MILVKMQKIFGFLTKKITKKFIFSMYVTISGSFGSFFGMNFTPPADTAVAVFCTSDSVKILIVDVSIRCSKR